MEKEKFSAENIIEAIKARQIEKFEKRLAKKAQEEAPEYYGDKTNNSTNLNQNIWNGGSKFLISNTSDSDVEKELGVNLFELEEYGSYDSEDGGIKPEESLIDQIYDSSHEENKEFSADERESLENGALNQKIYWGRRAKQYFRVDSKFFSELIEKRKNGEKDYYTTAIDNLLASGYVPEKVPVMLFEANPEDNSYAIEVLASKVLNFFEIPTAFNAMAYQTIEKETGGEKETQIQPLTISLDFLNSDQKFMCLKDYMIDFLGKRDNDHDCKLESVEEIVNAYEEIYKEHYRRVAEADPNFSISEEELENELKKMQEEVSYSVFSRKQPFSDWDCDEKNVGVLIDKKTYKIIPFLGFDLEFMFCNDNLRRTEEIQEKVYEAIANGRGLHFLNNALCIKFDHGTKSLIEDVRYIAEKCPQVLSKIVRKSDEILDKSNGKSFLEECFDEYIDLVGDEHKNLSTIRYNETVNNVAFIRDVCECYSENVNQSGL